MPGAFFAVLMMSTPQSQAAQHRHANEYALWNMHGANGFRNVDQRVQITRKANHSYRAVLGDFTATPGKGGYLGLQTDGACFDRTTGRTEIFSLWNANGSKGSGCGVFGGEGSGRSRRILYAIAPLGEAVACDKVPDRSPTSHSPRPTLLAAAATSTARPASRPAGEVAPGFP
ncbi:hypothetical protein ACFY0F_34845 [Streptomyces sp. NPDC001544]|uniref:hypothetical protein n=1 Tax=Streptomyces sp. NPDC001544 TaxID=3364584 RepID=UPI0036BFE59D